MAFSDISLPRADALGLRAAVPDSLVRLVAEVAGIVADPGVYEEEIDQQERNPSLRASI